MENKNYKDIDIEGKFLMKRLMETLDLYKKLLPDFTDSISEQELQEMNFTAFLYVRGDGKNKEIQRIVGKVSREMLIDLLISLHRQVNPKPEEIVEAGIRLMGKELLMNNSIKINMKDEGDFNQ